MINSSTPVHVVIPAFDEARLIGRTVERAGRYLADHRPGSTLCVVDDGSRDDTAGVARAAGAGLPEGVRFQLLGGPPNRGKGHAVRLGVLAAEAPLVLFCDADLSTDLEELPKLAAAIEAGADLAIGSRSISGARVEKRQPLYRMAMGKTFNKIMRLMTFLPVVDSQCGFKLFRREASARLFAASLIDGFAFDVEVLFLARKAGLSIAEVPVRWVNDEVSSVNPVVHSAQMLRDLARIRWLHQRTRV
ncbi:MAG: glycosyltransferase family 2 protein [Deltaproteobacteria bacterium]|nr:glycosyltransferase family 2 protein [Deltaproteobacteria bacterium]